MNRLFLITAASLTLGTACHKAAPSTKPAPAGATEAAITARDLERRLYLIADDSLMARESGSEGASKASAYVAAEFQRLGLEPGGDNGTYFQAVPFWDTRVDPKSTLTTSYGITLRLGIDFLPA